MSCYKKFLYRKESNYLLNNLTLRISDPIIKQKYDEVLGLNFNKLFYPVLAMEMCFHLWKIITYFSGSDRNLLSVIAPLIS